MTDYDWGLVRSKPGFAGISWIHRPVPFVTPEARENKVEGDVILRATFMADGTIADIQLVNGVDFMTESAIESLRHSKFRPATVNGIPINAHNVIVRVRVSFKEVVGARP
jgi:TonB family protein